MLFWLKAHPLQLIGNELYSKCIMKWIKKNIDRIIEMAWEDRTPFESIKMQFNFSEAEEIG